MKRENLKNKIATLGVTTGTFLIAGGQRVSADPQSALSSAKGQLDSQMRPIVNTVVVPVIDVLLVAVLVVAIAKAVMSYRHGRDVELGWIVLLIAGVILVSTFPVWGWQMIG